MRVLLIGAGMMGRGGIRALQQFDGIESVTVADLNLEAAQEFVESLDFPEKKAVQLDVTDTEPRYPREGYIGLQVHGGEGSGGMGNRARFRNVQVRELSDPQ